MSETGTSGRGGVSTEELLAVFEQTVDPVLTTTEIAEKLPIGKQAVHERLTELTEAGQITYKTVGRQGRVWWLSEVRADELDPTGDPFLDAPTYASGRSSISTNVDEELATNAAEESDAVT